MYLKILISQQNLKSFILLKRLEATCGFYLTSNWIEDTA